MRNGRPPVDRARLQFAVEMIRNGATVSEAARLSGIHRNTLYDYKISKKRIAAAKDAFVMPSKNFGASRIDEKIYEIERQIAGSVHFVVARANTPLIATAAAAQMESDKLQAACRAERLRNAALRFGREGRD